jgi:hypothetical protein
VRALHMPGTEAILIEPDLPDPCAVRWARLTVVAGDDATELDHAADARIRPTSSGSSRTVTP